MQLDVRVEEYRSYACLHCIVEGVLRAWCFLLLCRCAARRQVCALLCVLRCVPPAASRHSRRRRRRRHHKQQTHERCTLASSLLNVYGVTHAQIEQLSSSSSTTRNSQAAMRRHRARRPPAAAAAPRPPPLPLLPSHCRCCLHAALCARQSRFWHSAPQ